MTPDLLPPRMAAKVTVDDNGCWIWTGARASNGYGSRSHDGRIWSTHKLAYTLLVAPVPDGLQIDHLCRVRACCNPAHLEPVDQATNMRRARAHITHCPQGHEYTPDNIVWNHGTRRNCRACMKAAKSRWNKAAYAKRKAAAQNATEPTVLPMSAPVDRAA